MLLVRRVVGNSMSPTLRSGMVVLAYSRSRYSTRHITPGDIVIVRHAGRENIKRVRQVDAGSRRLFVTGDNADESTDSRHFGWLDYCVVVGRVWWPRV